MRFRFVHAADLHLDTPFSGIGKVAPEVADALREASLLALDHLVDLTVRRGARFLLLAGDSYDGPSRGLRAQRRLHAAVRRLEDAGVEVFIVHGNHDPLSGGGWNAMGDWPGNVTVFPARTVSARTVEIDGQAVATVHGISFAQPAESENLARRFARSGPGLQIGLLHCNVGDPDHAPYAPCSPQDLRDAGMDYWALGHVHRFAMPLSGGPWAVYPGVLQGRHPAPGEQGPKGAVVVECDSELGILAAPEFVELDAVRFAEAALEAAPEDGVLELVDRSVEAVMQRHQEASGRGLIVRLRIEGRTGAHGALTEKFEQGELLEDLRGQCRGVDPFAWVDDVRLDTTPLIDRESIRGRGDFAAELVATVDGLRADKDALQEAALRVLEDLPGHGRTLRQRGLLPDPDDLTLQSAEAECLRLLAGDDAS